MGYAILQFETWLEVEVSQGDNFKLTDHEKAKKCWLHWFSRITLNCKRNTIPGKLQCAKVISRDFDLEILQISNRLLLAAISAKIMGKTAICTILCFSLLTPLNNVQEQ